MIKQLSSKIVYKNKWMTVKEDEVEFGDGNKGIYGLIEKPHFAMIIPYFEDGFQLIKHYRYPVKGSFWEFPQGSHEENPEIDSLDLAKSELKEEAGLTAGKMEKIGFLYTAHGYSNQGFNVFLASKLKQGEAKPELTEQGMTSKKFSAKKVEVMIDSGEIKDAGTVAAFGLLKIKGII